MVVRGLLGNSVLGLTAVLLLCLTFRTWQQAAVWSSEEALWTQAVKASPQMPGPRFALGVAYQHQGRYAEARQEYNEVLHLAEDWKDADEFLFAVPYNLAKIASMEGDTQQSIDILQVLKARFPQYMDSIEFSQAVVLQRMGATCDEIRLIHLPCE